MPPSSRSARAPTEHPRHPGGQEAPFILYVEGPRDRDILRIWCQRSRPGSARKLRSAVILGGRQPNRAVDHLRSVRDAEPEARGLCVLDRDHSLHPEPESAEPGLEFFTWGRRHIESYLLVPEALRRLTRSQKERFHLDRFLREKRPDAEDEAAWRSLDAKRLLERDGPVSQALGRTVPAGQIARAMRTDELHADVVALLDRIDLGARPSG